MKMKTKRTKKEKNYTFKKASIGATLTWIIALFIIIFFFILFILGCSILGKGNKLVDMNDKIILDYKTDLIFQQSFFGFLETQINYDNQKIKIIHLVDEDLPDNQNTEKLEKFRELSNKFLQENANEYGKAWIRIYESNNKASQYFHGVKYQNSQAYYGYSAPSANPCDPNWKDAILFNFPLLKNKKIVICLEPEIK